MAVCQGCRVYKGTGKADTRARRVCTPLELPANLNQESLRDLSARFTRPYESIAIVDPQHVKVCFQIARKSRLPEDWTRALRERGIARRVERGADREGYQWGLEGFPGDGQEGREWMAGSLCRQGDGRGEDPHDIMHEQFSQLYQGDPIPPFPGNDVPRSPDFTAEELRDAVRRLKNGKSTGGDGVPRELLQHILDAEGGEDLLLGWFNRLLHREEDIPKDWGRAVMVLLPKCLKPELPKHLRPICLGSFANKVYARMLLSRAKVHFVYSGPFQNLGDGRQTLDYLWTVSRLMALDAEWKYGVYFLKLDIAKPSIP